MKCVMIIDSDLPAGIQVNTAAALGISIASEIQGLTGKKLLDRNGNLYEGVTNIPIPILTLKKEALKEKYGELISKKSEEVRVIGFNDVAQESLSYEDYEGALARTAYEQISFLGLCIYGPRKWVNKMTGNLKMLR